MLALDIVYDHMSVYVALYHFVKMAYIQCVHFQRASRLRDTGTQQTCCSVASVYYQWCVWLFLVACAAARARRSASTPLLTSVAVDDQRKPLGVLTFLLHQ